MFTKEYINAEIDHYRAKGPLPTRVVSSERNQKKRETETKRKTESKEQPKHRKKKWKIATMIAIRDKMSL